MSNPIVLPFLEPSQYRFWLLHQKGFECEIVAFQVPGGNIFNPESMVMEYYDQNGLVEFARELPKVLVDYFAKAVWNLSQGICEPYFKDCQGGTWRLFNTDSQIRSLEIKAEEALRECLALRRGLGE